MPSILVLNCGSSSVKFAVIDADTGARRITGLGERVGSADVFLTVQRDGDSTTLTPSGHGHREVLQLVLEQVRDVGARIDGVGHRVVHGGPDFTSSVLVDADVVSALEGVTDLAPLHVPANLAGVSAAQAMLPDVPQVAVFDTAFHLTMPPRAYRYAVPTDWYESHGVRRYGFHGTSHRYVSARAAELLERPLSELRLVTAHLGNGCSAAAVRDGTSVDTTMGLTPLEGLVMGTRSGDVDPGIVGYIAGRLGVDAQHVVGALNSRSGLLGLSGLSNDLRTVSAAAADGSASARLALDVFCYRLAKYIAALVVPLGRLDALVFTGGIGEHSAEVRSAVLGQLGFLGLTVDTAANAAHGRETGGRISETGPVQAVVVPTDEELMIARDTADLVASSATSGSLS